MPRLLAVIPHPDDEAYSFGATLAAAAVSGWECRVECASAGERGKRYDGGPTGAGPLGTARIAELARSCAVLGLLPPGCWDLPDGSLRDGPSQAERVANLLTSLAPDAVLCLGPDGAYGHPDHVAVWRWVSAAWETTGRQSALLFPAFPAGLFAPQWEKCRSMMGDPPDPPVESLGGAPAHYELRTRALRARKLSAIAAHLTQLPGGDPENLFPAGLVTALLPIERFSDATGTPQARVRDWFGRWQKAASRALAD